MNGIDVCLSEQLSTPPPTNSCACINNLSRPYRIPVYGFSSLISLNSKHLSFYIDTIRDIYEVNRVQLALF